MDSPPQVLSCVLDLHQQGRTDDALDVIFKWFDTAAKAGRWEDSTELLRSVDVTLFDEDILVGFLGASYPSRDFVGDERQKLWERFFAATGLSSVDFSGMG